MFLSAVIALIDRAFPKEVGESSRFTLSRLGDFLGLQSIVFNTVECKGLSGYRLAFTGTKELSTHMHARDVQPMLERLCTEEIINQSSQVYASKIFDILTEAEAKAHNVVPEKVHFHEVGAQDSLFDILGFATLWDRVIGEWKDVVVKSSPVEVGRGSVMTSHGELPIPAPATENIILSRALHTTATRDGECLTPTGAAIMGFLKPSFEIDDQKEMSYYSCGFGARDPEDYPNALKIAI